MSAERGLGRTVNHGTGAALSGHIGVSGAELLREKGLEEHRQEGRAISGEETTPQLTTNILPDGQQPTSRNLNPAARPVYVEASQRAGSTLPVMEKVEAAVVPVALAVVEPVIQYGGFAVQGVAKHAVQLGEAAKREGFWGSLKKVGKGLLKLGEIALGIDSFIDAYKHFKAGNIGRGLLHLGIGTAFAAFTVCTAGSGGVMLALGRGALKVGFRALARGVMSKAGTELGKTLTKEVVTQAYKGMGKEAMGLIEKLATRKLTRGAVKEICEKTVEEGTEKLLRSHKAVEILERATVEQLNWLKKAAVKDVAAELGVSNTRARVMKMMLGSNMAEGAIKKHMVDEMTNVMVKDLIDKGARDAFMGVMRKELAELGAKRGLDELAVKGLVEGAEEGFEIGIRKGVLKVVKEAVERAFRRFKGDYIPLAAENPQPQQPRAKQAAAGVALLGPAQLEVLETRAAEKKKQWWGRIFKRTERHVGADGNLEEVAKYDVSDDAA